MVLPLIRSVSVSLIARGSRAMHKSAPLASYKDYDKKVLLDPEDVKYRPGDKRFLPGPTPADTPYPRLTKEEQEELSKVKLEDEVQAKSVTKVDPNAVPFNEVLLDTEDNGKFTKTEVIPDNDLRWFWVDRLMPKQYLDQPIREDSKLIAPMPTSTPNLPYFVSRTRSRLYPLYREYKVVGRDHRTYWRNRWDGLFNKYTAKDVLLNLDSIKWENNEKTIVLSMVGKVQGDIWKFEEDARKYLEDRHPEIDRILSGVNEVRATVHFKGDFMDDLHSFLKLSGF